MSSSSNNQNIRATKPAEDDGTAEERRVNSAYNQAIGALRHLERVLIEARNSRSRPASEPEDDDNE